MSNDINNEEEFTSVDKTAPEEDAEIVDLSEASGDARFLDFDEDDTVLLSEDDDALDGDFVDDEDDFEDEDSEPTASSISLHKHSEPADMVEPITISQRNPVTGEITEHMLDLATPLLSREEARDLTDQIKSTTNILFVQMKRAYSGRAWEALGYDSFIDYAKGEFNVSKSQAYRLLGQANLVEAIEAKLPPGTVIEIGVSTANNLKNVLPGILEELDEREVGSMDTNHAQDVLTEIIKEQQAAAREQQLSGVVAEEFDTEKKYEGPFDPNYQFQEPEEEEEEKSDLSNTLLQTSPSEVAQKLDDLYNLYSALRNLAKLGGDGTELLPFIPGSKTEEFTELISAASIWLTAFGPVWAVEQARREEEQASLLDDGFDDDDFEDDDFEDDES